MHILAGLPLTSGHPYNATYTGDAHLAVEAVHTRFPAAPLYAAGFSLGAVILTKYLAEADQGQYAGEGVHAHIGGMMTCSFHRHAMAVSFCSPVVMHQSLSALFALVCFPLGRPIRAVWPGDGMQSTLQYESDPL